MEQSVNMPMLKSMREPSIPPLYYARAKQHLYDRDRLESATDDEVLRLAHALRHEDFLRHIDPYVQQKTRIVGRFMMLQVKPETELPEIVKKTLAMFDELIALEARKFGYDPDAIPHV